MPTTTVSTKDKKLFDTPSGESKIMAISDLHSDLIHYGIVREPDTSVAIPAHSLEVETPNGVKLSRVFDDKLDKAGLNENDECVILFKDRMGYANVAQIKPRPLKRTRS